jgi:oxygen-independent coproporphyrinogen-3 oxidase
MAIDLKRVTPDRDGQPEQAFLKEIDALREFAREGLVEIEDDVVTVTGEGRAFVRIVAAVFDTYLPRNQGRHSAAV